MARFSVEIVTEKAFNRGRLFANGIYAGIIIVIVPACSVLMLMLHCGPIFFVKKSKILIK